MVDQQTYRQLSVRVGVLSLCLLIVQKSTVRSIIACSRYAGLWGYARLSFLALHYKSSSNVLLLSRTGAWHHVMFEAS